MSARRPRQPWSMKWIFIAILLVIVPYTFIRLHYRKPDRAFEPYADMKNQANTLRLLSAGYRRITLEADRPVEPPRLDAPAAVVSSALPGLPSALAETLIEPPFLAREILSVTAPTTTNSLFAYPLAFTCTLPDQKHQLSGAFLYVRDDELVFVPQFEAFDGDLSARTREYLLRLTIPSGSLEPGTYRALLPGAHGSKSWSIDVK